MIKTVNRYLVLFGDDPDNSLFDIVLWEGRSNQRRAWEDIGVRDFTDVKNLKKEGFKCKKFKVTVESADD